jgi:hypothetical protein
MTSLADPNLFQPEVDRRVSALSTMDFDQIDRNVEDVLGYIQALVHAGVVDRFFKEVMRQKANEAATDRKVEIEAENVAWLAFQVIALSSLGVGAFLWVTYANYLSVQNASTLVFLAESALAAYGLRFVATRVIRSLWRKFSSWKKPR